LRCLLQHFGKRDRWHHGSVEEIGNPIAPGFPVE
jgi:hypothetical protein